jgi:hypothetical protein
MSNKAQRALLEVAGDSREFTLASPSVRDYAMLEELSFVRREAQAEANEAYEDWREWPGAETWIVFLAAQDRADAAQDELADWVRQLAA